MASFSVARAKHYTLTASQVDQITFTTDTKSVEVVNRNGTAEIYFTVDGSTPTVGGDDTFVVPAAIGSVTVASGAADVVKIISSGTPTVSVSNQ